MIRQSTFAPYTRWTPPLVSEVALVMSLLKKHGYDVKELARVTGLRPKNLNIWTARYKLEPDNISPIPYPCWCFLCALVGNPNIQSKGRRLNVDLEEMTSFFSPSAFKPNDAFHCPTPEQFSHLIDNENYPMLTTDFLSTFFHWHASKFTHGITHGALPFLNWSLILMAWGMDIQKMILTDLHAELNIVDFISRE